MVVTGVRWAESAMRKENRGVVNIDGKPKTTQKKANELGVQYKTNKYGGLIMNDDNDENRRLAEFCYRTQKMLLNPIVDWTDEEVWEFLNDIAKVPHCCLYDEGYTRIGCIGCPMSNVKEQTRELTRYPKYYNMYIKAFDRMLQKKEREGKNYNWKNAEDVMRFWLTPDKNKNLNAEGLPTTWQDGEEVMRWWLQEGQEETEND